MSHLLRPPPNGARAMLCGFLVAIVLTGLTAVIETMIETRTQRYLEYHMTRTLLFFLAERSRHLLGVLFPALVLCGVVSALGLSWQRRVPSRPVLRAVALTVLAIGTGYWYLRDASSPGVHSAVVFLFVAWAVVIAVLSPETAARAARFAVDIAARPAVIAVTALLTALTLIPLLAAPRIAQAAAAGRPSVLLLVVDTLRADHLGIYGAEPSPTPILDAFARECLLFQGVAQGSNTINSAPALLASLLPSEHGYFNYRQSVPNAALLLPEVLRDRGYETFAISTNPHVSRRNGLAQGFDTFLEELTWHDTDAATVNRVFLSWLDQRTQQRPFFALLWYVDPHVPYDPAPAARNDLVPEAMRHLISKRTRRPVGHRLSDTEKAVSRLLYRGEVASFDRAFGELLAALRERDLYQRSLIVLTADHGESLWERENPLGQKLIGHGISLYREEVDVPLLLRLPNGERASRVPQRVRLDALPTTVLDALGFAVSSFNGRRASSLLDPADRRDPVSELITDEYGPYVMRRVEAKGIALVRTWRYIDRVFDPPLEECLDISAGDRPIPCTGPGGLDPSGYRSLVDLHERSFARPLTGDPAVFGGARGNVENEQRLRERLETLGYLN